MAGKNKRWVDREPSFELIVDEYHFLGSQLWSRAKQKRGDIVEPATTLKDEAERVIKSYPNFDQWLVKEAEVIIKFYRPLWWLNPANWFKAYKMRKRRDLCIYVMTTPHMDKAIGKWGKPVISATINHIFEPLLKLSRNIARWFQPLAHREKCRNDNLRIRELSRADGERRKLKLQKERVENIKRKAAEDAHRMKLMEIENRTNDLLSKSRDDIKSISKNIGKLGDFGRKTKGFCREEIVRGSQRRVKELGPTVARLQAMMALVYIGARTGISTTEQMSSVIAEHDRIASRNGLTRHSYDRYTYSIFEDKRRYDGAELEDAARVHWGDHRFIKTGVHSGAIRI